jgi:hypothetical protein
MVRGYQKQSGVVSAAPAHRWLVTGVAGFIGSHTVWDSKI